MNIPTRLRQSKQPAMNTNSHPKWGPILIVGGSGRLGFFIAEQLLDQPECGHVFSISRSQEIAHPCDGVNYRIGDVRDADALANLLREIKPETIINAAAPAHANTLTPSSEFEEVFVKAQDTLMSLAKEVGTKYMVCTTSSVVAQGYHHVEVDESAPLWPENSTAWAYWVQRARAERILLATDSPALQTVSLRLPLIIGEREYAFVSSMVKTMRDGQTKVQIGSDTGLMATVSGRDAARAHILALRGLMKSNNDVHGEAFYIIGEKPLSFWTMARIIWSEAGGEQAGAPYILPEWLARIIASCSDLAMRPFGIEPQLSMHVLRFMCNTWTYNGSKARERLGYVPKDDTEEELRKSVRWFLHHESI
jgi:sterol-4alpha-carboxylate 3-dehydrogenase (decarboxylating)